MEFKMMYIFSKEIVRSSAGQVAKQANVASFIMKTIINRLQPDYIEESGGSDRIYYQFFPTVLSIFPV